MAQIELTAAMQSTAVAQVRLGRSLGLSTSFVGQSGQALVARPVRGPKPTLKITDIQLRKGP